MRGVSLGAVIAGLFGLGTLALLTAFVTLLSSGAPGLSVWVIVLVMGGLSLGIILSLPKASEGVHGRAVALLCIFVFFLVFWPKYAFVRIPGMPAISPTRFFQALLILMWFYLLTRSPAHRAVSFPRVLEFKLIFLLLGSFLFIKLAGVFVSDSPFSSAVGLTNEIISVYLVLLIALTLIRSHADLRKILATLIIATFFVITVGAYEILSGKNAFLPFFEIDSQYIFNVLREKTRYGASRIQATFNHPLTLGEYMAMVVPLIAVFWLQRPRSFWRSTILVFLVAAAGVMVVSSGSRAGLGAFMMTASLTLLFLLASYVARAKDAVRAGLISLLVVLGIFLSVTLFYAYSDILIGRTSREIGSAIVRIEMWKAGLPLAFERPILGYGHQMAASTLGFRGSFNTLTIDSYYLSILLDAGFFALAFFMVFLMVVIGTGIRNGLTRGANAGQTMLISVSLMAFAAVKIVLSLPHNHGIVMLFVAALLYLVHEDRLSLAPRSRALRSGLA